MADSPENRPLSKETRTSLLDTGWSDAPPSSEGDSTVQISRDELEKLVTVAPGSDAPPRELPRYEASHDDNTAENQAAHPDDATKRISYAALLGGSQAGRGGPRRPAPEVHELPTLIAHQPLSEEAARALALAAVPSIDDAVEIDEPLPSFEQEVEPAFEKFERAAAALAAPYGGAPAEPVPAPRRKLDSNPLPVLGFDDSDVTVRAVIEIPPEATVPAPVPRAVAPASVPQAAVPPSAPLFAQPLVASPAVAAPTEVPPFGAPPFGAPPFGAPPFVAPIAATPLVSAAGLRGPLHPALTTRVADDMLALEAPAEPPGLFRALGQPCSIFGVRVPLAVLWLIPTALALGALVVLLTAARVDTAPEVRAAPPPPEASAKAPEPSLRERAARGDLAAYETLNRVAERERSTADALALAKARAYVELRNLEQLARDIQAGRAKVADETTRERLLAFVTDARTAPEALAVLAQLPGPDGPDLLYEVWTGTKRSNETTQLAHELLYKPEVRQRASEALAVALDLRGDPACQDIPEILPRAKAHADWRSLHLLGKLLVVKGCGTDNRQDCYPCLRTVQYEEAIGDAIKVVRRRPRPKPKP